jgi:drug/metabolite transporter (DMT)-like permease
MNQQDLLLVLLTGFLAGLITILNKRLSSSSSHPVEILVVRFGLSLLVAFAILWLFVRKETQDAFSNMSKQDWVHCAFFVIITFTIAWIALRLMKNNKGSTVSFMCVGLGLMSSLILSYLVHHEKHSKTVLFGFLLILIGVITVIKGQ